MMRQGVTDANAMGFIHLNVHPWLVIKLYLTFSLILVQSTWFMIQFQLIFH
jgi:hypothetical protein